MCYERAADDRWIFFFFPRVCAVLGRIWSKWNSHFITKAEEHILILEKPQGITLMHSPGADNDGHWRFYKSNQNAEF